jgi:arsenate reductase-like glutaredoxin family protein
LLAQERVELEERDFFKQPFTVQELRGLLKSWKLTPRDVISTKSPSFREMGLDLDKLSNEQILKLMVQELRLVRRPLIVIEGKPVIGLDRERVKELLR